MNYDLEKVKKELTEVIAIYCSTHNISIFDSTSLVVSAPGIWKALVSSGKMPKSMRYEDLISAIINASILS